MTTSLIGLAVLLVVASCARDLLHQPSLRPLPDEQAISLIEPSMSWPIDTGDAAGTRSRLETPSLGFSVRWRSGAPGGQVVGIVADEHRLLTAMSGGTVRAYETASGALLWQAELGGTIDASPTLGGGRAYVPLRSGELVAIQLATGDSEWRSATGGPLAASPMVADGVVYTVNRTGLVAHEATSGEQLWRRDLDGLTASVTPALDDELLVVGAFGRVYFIDRWTGEVVFHLRGLYFERGDSVAIVDQLVVASARRRLLAIEREKRRPWWDGVRGAWTWAHIVGIAPAPPWRAALWEEELAEDPMPLAVGQGRVLEGAPSGRVTAWDVRTGTQLWTTIVAPLVASPIVLGELAVLAHPHSVTVLSLATGDQRATLFETSETLQTLIPVGDSLLIATAGGELVNLAPLEGAADR